MHSRTKSSVSPGPSPNKRPSRDRAESSRSGSNDFTTSCLPPVRIVNKEVHAKANAFYGQMLEAQKAQLARERANSNEAGQRQVSETSTIKRARSEEPVTTLMPTSSPPVIDGPRGHPTTATTPSKPRPDNIRLLPEGTHYAVPTHRALIEARKEKKLMTMLATEVPLTPSTSTVSFEDDPKTITYDATKSVSKKPVAPPSPRKRFLGLNISVPSFMTSSSEINEEPLDYSTIPPPPRPPLPPSAFRKSLAAHQTGIVTGAELDKEKQKREDAVSHLPSKVRQFMQRQDDALNIMDSPTLGRNHPAAKGIRSVSDTVSAATSSKKSANDGQGQDGAIARSKTVHHKRDPETETVPPTPLPKDTPPKVTVQESTPVKSVPRSTASEEKTGNEKSTPIQGAHIVRNNYPELIHNSPSIYSLYAEFQDPSSSASPERTSNHAAKDKIEELEILKPTVYGGAWNAGHAVNGKEREVDQSEQRQSAPAVYYSPSIYSTVWSPVEGKKKQKEKKVLHSNSQSPRVDRHIHPSDESSRTLEIRASESVLNLAKKREQQAQEAKEKEKHTMLINKCEGLLPSSELVSSPSVNVQMPLMQNETTYKHENHTQINGAANAGDGPLKSATSDTENSTQSNFRDSMSVQDYYPPEIAQYPAAMPTPLFGRDGPRSGMATSPPFNAQTMLPTPSPGFPNSRVMQSGHGLVVMPDGSNILTHFDVLNRHIMEASISLHQAQDLARDQLLTDMSNKHAAAQATSNEHSKHAVEAFQKVDKQISTSSSAAKDMLAKVEQLEVVCVDFAVKLAQLGEQNSQILSRFDAMQQQVTELGKKYDDSRSFIASEVVRMMQSNATPYYQSSMSMANPHAMHGQVVFMDPTTRMYTYGTNQVQHASPMHGSGQTMYGGMAMQGVKEERTKRSDDLGGYQRNSGDYNRRGYESFRRGSDPRSHEGKHYNDMGNGHQRHS